ncbi:MAG: DUF937 domain-containing protein [Bacteroidales bacterium]|nr:DUF937 domain-containing protein [Bacteroidales bacterium]
MLKNLIELIKENAGEAIINNPAIPNEKNNAAIETAAGALFKALKGTAKTGGVNSIKDLFQEGTNVNSNPVVNNISDNVAGELMKKFGLNKGAANSIVAMLIPIVLSKLIKKTNDPNDKSINLESIIGSLAAGKSGVGGLGGILGSLKGLLGSRS